MERPILFSAEMVRAILEGRKTQTRRVVKPQPPEDIDKLFGPEIYKPAITDQYGELREGGPIFGAHDGWGEWGIKCPYQPGDTLWVRESLRRGMWNDGEGIYYEADGEWCWDLTRPCRWVWEKSFLPARFMPRGIARLFLTVKDVRVERLQEITGDDAYKEGIPEWTSPEQIFNPRIRFRKLWDSLNAKRGYGWDVNPWVWVIEFERRRP
jgi:hypothetical protein